MSKACMVCPLVASFPATQTETKSRSEIGIKCAPITATTAVPRKPANHKIYRSVSPLVAGAGIDCPSFTSTSVGRAEQKPAQRGVELVQLLALEMTGSRNQPGGHGVYGLAVAGNLEMEVRPSR